MPNRSPALDALIRSAEAAAVEAAADEALILARLNIAPERSTSSAQRRPSRPSTTAGRRQMKATAVALVMVVLVVSVAWLRG
jgi:hypothetical protein